MSTSATEFLMTTLISQYIKKGEVIVHYNDSVIAVEAIRDIVVENKLPVNYITEVCNHGSYLQ